MADVFDYLKRRSVLSFAEDPFNEVDNLVLALLAYADFKGVLNDGSAYVAFRGTDTTVAG